MSEHFAAIGNDGTRPVVWGLGDTAEAATREATENLRHASARPWEDVGGLRVVSIDEERAARIDAGDVSADDL